MIVRALAALFTLTLLSLPCTSANDVFVPPVGLAHPVTANTAAGADLLGVILAEPASVPWMVSMDGGSAPSQQTRVGLAYDEQNLYLAFTCSEAEMAKLQAAEVPQDSRIFGDDCVEIFLSPKNDGKSYFHLVANAAGSRYDERDKPNDPSSWNGQWKVQIRKGQAGWQALVTIPFTEMSTVAPKPGDVWSVNFARHEVACVENSSWSPVGPSFHNPLRFGQMVFGGRTTPRVTVGHPRSIASPGRHIVSFASTNLHDARFEIEMSVDGESKALIPVRGTGTHNRGIPVRLMDDGAHKLGLSVTDTSTSRVIMRAAPLPVHIPEHFARLDRADDALSPLVPPTTAVRTELAGVRKEMEVLQAYAISAIGDNAKWAELGIKIDEMEKKISRLRYACADAGGVGYALGADSNLRKIMRDRFFEGKLGGPVQIHAARNDYEAAQAVVIAYDKALEDVSVSLTPLKGPRGTIVPRDSIELNIVDYVRTRKPIYPVDYVGWWPDPLMPMEAFDIPQGGIQPIWITIHPSEKMPAGIYFGEVVVRPKNAPESSIPIEIRVWDFTLPKERHLGTAFTFSDVELTNWYGKNDPKIREAYYQFLLDHRLNIMSLYTPTPLPTKENLPFCVERGQDFFNLGYLLKGTDLNKLEANVRDYQAFLKQKGWSTMGYIYGFDEVKPEFYQDAIDRFGWAKKTFPDIPTMCTVVPNETLDPYIDIWVPLTRNWKADVAADYTKRGDKVWWYVCCGPLAPYANYFVDYPLVDPRILSWMNWKYQVPGVLYYTVTNWHSNRLVENLPTSRIPHEDPEAIAAIKAGKKWPEVPWNTWTYGNYNGDGHLIYPGPDGNPISSVRMEALRDGFEDYEMFYMLNELVQKAEKSPQSDKALLVEAKRLLAVDESVVKSLTEYTKDPDAMLRYRQSVGETIEKLSH